uniref:Tumor protein p53-inducible protein 13 n=1 Tax=Callorhinchus milii TaxID=7868 RepID=A0A4W3IPQ3_CALMI
MVGVGGVWAVTAAVPVIAALGAVGAPQRDTETHTHTVRRADMARTQPELRVALTLWLLLCWAQTEAKTCENCEVVLDVDFLPVEALICPGPSWPLPEKIVPHVAKEVHHEQHGGIAFLYHPCVDPRLKKELSLLAKACVCNQTITPHPNLTQGQPLALVGWGRRLEMSAIDLREAVLWLRKSVSRARGSKMGDGKEKLASKPAHRAAVCPGHRVKVLQSYFMNADFGPSIRKWDKTKGSALSAMLQSGCVLLRRRREVQDRQKPVRPIQHEAQSPAKARVQREVEERNKMAKNITSAVNTGRLSSGVTKPQSPPNPVLSVTDGSPDQILGRERNGVSQGLESETQQNSDPQGTIGALDPKADMGKNSSVAGHSQPSNIESRRGAEQDQSGQRHWVGNSTSEGKPPQAQGRQSEGGIKKQEDNRGNSPHFARQQKEPKAISVPVTGKDRRPPNDAEGQSLEGGKSAKVPAQPLQDAGGSSSSGERDGLGAAEPGQVAANETAPNQGGLSSHNGSAAAESANVKCKCEDKTRQNSEAAAVKRTDSRLDSKASYVPTPRTEEAAWAAAALTFLFVFLTVAVLYTRLYRKFIKSHSLYWAPGSNREENVTGRNIFLMETLQSRLTLRCGVGGRALICQRVAVL